MGINPAPGLLVVATVSLGTRWYDRVRLRPGSTRLSRVAPPTGTPARSVFFCVAFRVLDGDCSCFAFAFDYTGVKPAPVELPARTCLVQDLADGESTHLG